MFLVVHCLVGTIPFHTRVKPRVGGEVGGLEGTRTRIHYVCSPSGPSVRALELIQIMNLGVSSANLSIKT